MTLTIADLIAAAIVGGGGVASLWLIVTSFTEKLAAPRRAKLEAERTLIDKAVIEADRRVDLIDIDRLERFAADFVASYLDDILRMIPGINQIEIAANFAVKAHEAFKRRNPELNARQNPSIETITEKLAGAIGRNDVLATAIRNAIK